MAKMKKKLIIFVLFLGSYESLCVIFACIKIYGVGFHEKISAKTLLIYIVYPPFNFSYPYF